MQGCATNQGSLKGRCEALAITSKDDWDNLLANKQYVLVMFTSRFCASCKTMKPSYLGLRKQVRRDTPMVIIDIDKSDRQMCVQALGEVAFVPTFQIYKKGERVAYFMANGKEDLQNQVLQAGLGRRFNLLENSCWSGIVRLAKHA